MAPSKTQLSVAEDMLREWVWECEIKGCRNVYETQPQLFKHLCEDHKLDFGSENVVLRYGGYCPWCGDTFQLDKEVGKHCLEKHPDKMLSDGSDEEAEDDDSNDIIFVKVVKGHDEVEVGEPVKGKKGASGGKVVSKNDPMTKQAVAKKRAAYVAARRKLHVKIPVLAAGSGKEIELVITNDWDAGKSSSDDDKVISRSAAEEEADGQAKI